MGKRILLFAVALALFFSACSAKGGRPEESPAVGAKTPQGQAQTAEREKLCFDFFAARMITAQGGVRTNYLDKAANPELATGAEVLSESMGLLMLYAVRIRDEALFTRSLRFVQGYLDTGAILSYRYSPKTGAYPVNAFVDDIRIIRSLLDALEAFGGDYKELATSFADRLYATNVKGSRLYDMYDGVHRANNDSIALCYVDLDTIRALSGDDPRWNDVFETMREIVLEGYIGDEFPLYRSSFSYASMAYSEGDIVTVQSALTALSLAKIGECPAQTLDYFKACLKSGAVYGTYHQDGTPAGATESTAVYAILAMLAEASGDDEMYELCIGRMNRFQVTEEHSEVYGAFADAKTMDLYAFDNLTALLAYRRG